MTVNITAISMPMILNFKVNAYLISLDSSFILIDTGMPGKGQMLAEQLERVNCKAGDLKLIILTHGDFDHCGNAVYLRDRFGGKIAMHEGDRGMVEEGNMFWNRNPPNFIMRRLMSMMINLSEDKRFTPDVFLKEGDTLRQYGWDARVIELPGHSKGSIGFLTADDDLICGDLLANNNKPQLWIPDNVEDAHASLDKLQQMSINTVYPGHGKPFLMAELP